MDQNCLSMQNSSIEYKLIIREDPENFQDENRNIIGGIQMSLFQRIFKVGESQAHSLVDKLEDPIKNDRTGYS